jgi:hypothetical protein
MRYAILCLALAASPALAKEYGPYNQTCSYQDLTESPEDSANEVPCTMRYVSTPTGLLFSFRFGGRTVTVENSSDSSNGLWRAVRINGKPGLSLELWRGSYVAATNDMSISFEWRDRGSPKYPAN